MSGTQKGLVIGNSQVGALRMADGAYPAGVSVEYLSLPGGNGPRLRFDGTRVLPPENVTLIKAEPEALAQGVDVTGYDFILFSALGLSASRASNAQHLLNRFVLAEFAQTGADRPAASQAFLAAALRAALNRTPAAHSLRGLARVFDGPIIVQPFPLPNVQLKTREDSNLAHQYGDALGAFQSWFTQTQHAAMAELVADIVAQTGKQVTLLDHPEPAWVAEGFTPLSEAQGGDCWHMNESYGARVVAQAMAVLGVPVPA